MSRKEITITPEIFLASVQNKKDDVKMQKIDNLHDRAVDAINAGDDVIPVSDDDLEFIPAVNDLLYNKGFFIIRYLGNRVQIRVV